MVVHFWCRWEPHSYGYHGDDGKKFHSNGQGEDYGPQFTVGDVIGAGIHIQRQEMFFTCALSICLYASPAVVLYERALRPAFGGSLMQCTCCLQEEREVPRSSI